MTDALLDVVGRGLRVIDLGLEFAQVGCLGRNAAVTRGFVPGGDKLSRIRTPFYCD